MADTDNMKEAPPNGAAVEAALTEDTNPESKIPEKFRGKSPDEIVSMYQELESRFGKQGQELGEMRKTYDAYIKSELENRISRDTSTASDTTDSTEYLEEDTHRDSAKNTAKESLSPAEQTLQELRKEKFLTKLEKDHSDFQDIVKDESFQKWVLDSPVRQELFRRADENLDYNSANELFSIWKERSATAKEAEAVVDQEREQQYKEAEMEVGTPNNPVSTKKYRRVDIMDLMQRNPDRYAQLAPEIRKAYAEGRVI